MAALKDAAPPPPLTPGVATRGRNNYSAFGVLRTKPGRADSSPSASMSCSDKIASWTYLGIQGALLSHLMEPIYVNGFVIGGVDPRLEPRLMKECARAFSLRTAEQGNVPWRSFTAIRSNTPSKSSRYWFILSTPANGRIHPSNLLSWTSQSRSANVSREYVRNLNS